MWSLVCKVFQDCEWTSNGDSATEIIMEFHLNVTCFTIELLLDQINWEYTSKSFFYFTHIGFEWKKEKIKEPKLQYITVT